MVAQPFFWTDRVTFHYFFAGEFHKLPKSNGYCYNYEIKSVCIEKRCGFWFCIWERNVMMIKGAICNYLKVGVCFVLGFFWDLVITMFERIPMDSQSWHTHNWFEVRFCAVGSCNWLHSGVGRVNSENRKECFALRITLVIKRLKYFLS